MTQLKRQVSMFNILVFMIIGASLFTQKTHAAWFESSGQAAIRNGNIELARQNATQEAIKQVLLFAGASVQSVQKMANGVLQNDDLTIRASGEVNSIELIDEVQQNGYLTVSLRADIFSNTRSCQSSAYQKSIVTTWHPIHNREQATTGHIFDIGTKLPQVLQQSFNLHAQQSNIQSILPFYYSLDQQSAVQDVMALSRQSNSQYVLVATITDLSVSTSQRTNWQFWEKDIPIRNFSYHVSLYDGYTGAKLWQKAYGLDAPWEFDLHQNVDTNGNALWQSQYGLAISSILKDVATHVDEILSCSPAYGRILQVRSDQLTLNIGSNQGVQNGDELTLFQLQQIHNPSGQLFNQFNLHPTAVRVVSVSPNTAIAMSKDGSLLANVQANDFVSRQ